MDTYIQPLHETVSDVREDWENLKNIALRYSTGSVVLIIPSRTTPEEQHCEHCQSTRLREGVCMDCGIIPPVGHYTVEVSPAETAEEKRTYIVRATSQRDAMQIAFAIDGGQSRDVTDHTDLGELAAEYCRIVDFSPMCTPVHSVIAADGRLRD